MLRGQRFAFEPADYRALMGSAGEPTAGALFNRPNPRDANGEFVLPYVRSRDEFVKFRNERMWVDADGFHTERPENPKDWQQTRKYVPVSGKDWTGVRIALAHRGKQSRRDRTYSSCCHRAESATGSSPVCTRGVNRTRVAGQLLRSQATKDGNF